MKNKRRQHLRSPAVPGTVESALGENEFTGKLTLMRKYLIPTLHMNKLKAMDVKLPTLDSPALKLWS